MPADRLYSACNTLIGWTAELEPVTDVSMTHCRVCQNVNSPLDTLQTSALQSCKHFKIYKVIENIIDFPMTLNHRPFTNINVLYIHHEERRSKCVTLYHTVYFLDFINVFVILICTQFSNKPFEI